MGNVLIIAEWIGGAGVVLGVLWTGLKWAKKITDGALCQLRSDMLRTYYRHRETEKIRQYEYENFVMAHDAYRALGGNSFIEKIYAEVQTWEVVS